MGNTITITGTAHNVAGGDMSLSPTTLPTPTPDLAGLLDDLRAVLLDSPATHAGAATQLDILAHAASVHAARETPNAALLSITRAGLHDAAQNLAAVVPAVVPIVERIIAALRS